MSNPKDIAENLVKLAKDSFFIRFPKTWDDGQIRQQVGSTLMLNRNSDGTFDQDSTILALIEKYGVEEPKVEVAKEKPEKRKANGTPKDDVEEDKKDDKPKKIKKSEIMACEENRGLAEAIKEIGDIYFQNKDNMKGGVYSRAAKAIREAEVPIKDKKAAMGLKGVGKGIAAYINEYITTGMVAKLEEMRAGVA